MIATLAVSLLKELHRQVDQNDSLSTLAERSVKESHRKVEQNDSYLSGELVKGVAQTG